MNPPIWSKPFFNEIKEKVERERYAAQIFERLKRRTEHFIEKPLDIPLIGGGWSHNYNCPDDGASLQLIDMHHHKCPVCNKIWSGSPWDEVAIADEHRRYGLMVFDCAILYALTDDQRWAEWAKKVMLFYADHYVDYPVHDRFGGADHTGARVQCQTLSESTWIIPIAQAFHILRQASYITDEEFHRIEKGFFMPAVEIIRGNRMGTSNWQSWHNAAVATIGAALGKEDLFDEAINLPGNGFLFQMENSLGDDGFWYEGAWGYHFYTVEAQTSLAIAGASIERKIYEDKRFQSMFRAPIDYCFPDNTLPPVHDSGEFNIAEYAYLYEFAYRYFGVGKEIIQSSERRSLFSLLYGVNLDKTADGKSKGCGNKDKDAPVLLFDLKRAGMLVGKTTDVSKYGGQAFLLDYGEHGGGHGHYDKLNLLYYAGGHCWINDAGMVRYANPLHGRWFKHTVSHNTVVINGTSQAPSKGFLKRVEVIGDKVLVEAVSDSSYKGVILKRKFVFGGDFLIDVCEVESRNGPRTVDWVIHTLGQPDQEELEKFELRKLTEGALGSSDGYEYIRQITELCKTEKRDNSMLEWRWNEESNDWFRVYILPGNESERLFIAETPAMPGLKKRSTFMRRQSGVEYARFISIFSAGKERTAPYRIECMDDSLRSGGLMQLRIVKHDGRTEIISL